MTVTDVLGVRPRLVSADLIRSRTRWLATTCHRTSHRPYVEPLVTRTVDENSGSKLPKYRRLIDSNSFAEQRTVRWWWRLANASEVERSRGFFFWAAKSSARGGICPSTSRLLVVLDFSVGIRMLYRVGGALSVFQEHGHLTTSQKPPICSSRPNYVSCNIFKCDIVRTLLHQLHHRNSSSHASLRRIAHTPSSPASPSLGMTPGVPPHLPSLDSPQFLDQMTSL